VHSTFGPEVKPWDVYCGRITVWEAEHQSVKTEAGQPLISQICVAQLLFRHREQGFYFRGFGIIIKNVRTVLSLSDLRSLSSVR
jgi:hypothetical protein